MFFSLKDRLFPGKIIFCNDMEKINQTQNVFGHCRTSEAVVTVSSKKHHVKVQIFEMFRCQANRYLLTHVLFPI